MIKTKKWTQKMERERKKKKTENNRKFNCEKNAAHIQRFVLIWCLFSFWVRVYYTFFTLSLYTSDFVLELSEKKMEQQQRQKKRALKSTWARLSLRKVEPVDDAGLNRANYEFSLESNATIDHVPNSIPSHFN